MALKTVNLVFFGIFKPHHDQIASYLFCLNKNTYYIYFHGYLTITYIFTYILLFCSLNRKHATLHLAVLVGRLVPPFPCFIIIEISLNLEKKRAGGAVFEVTLSFGRSSGAKDCKKKQKSKV